MDRVRLLCFDLDNTLYKRETRLLSEIHKRIVEYVKCKMSVEDNEAIALIMKWKRKYHSTLQGLIQEVHIDEYDYLEYIHNLRLCDYLYRDNELKEVLNLVQEKKIIITDSYGVYANRVIEELGLSHCFDGIYATENMDFFYKCHTGCLKKVILRACREVCEQMIRFNEIVLIDDDYNSLYAAKTLGLITAYISQKSESVFDYNANNVVELLQKYY